MRAGQTRTSYKTRIDLPAEIRTGVIDLLNQRLADATDLYSQTKQAHWNVKGKDFYQLHKLFDELAEKVERHVDLLAERVTALGGIARGTVRMAAASTSLPEAPDVAGGGAWVEALAERYAKCAESVRNAIGDAEDADDRVTADVFTEIARDLDEALYFLEAHVQGGEGRKL